MRPHDGWHELPSSADSVGRARSIVREAGEGLPADVVDDAELLVSELMSNAVRHGGAEIRLSASHRSGALTVSVFDAGTELPVVRATGVDRTAASGRGLRMAARLADGWGVEVPGDGRGKVVWFRLAAVRPSEEPGENTKRGRAGGHGADHHAAR